MEVVTTILGYLDEMVSLLYLGSSFVQPTQGDPRWDFGPFTFSDLLRRG